MSKTVFTFSLVANADDYENNAGFDTMYHDCEQGLNP